MNGSLQYSALTRLLALNSQTRDLENQMMATIIPEATAASDLWFSAHSDSHIADMQDEMDQVARASLATCWLGNSNHEDEEYEL